MDKKQTIKRLEQLAKQRDELPDRIGEAIEEARLADASWTAIGQALGMTHVGAMKAHQRWKERT
jgi:hypothetical protein